MESLRYETIIELAPVPVQWIPTFELFIQDLPNFPLVYFHSCKKNIRVYGFPITVNFVDFNEGYCTPRVRVLCNKNTDKDKTSSDIVKKELSERFGLENRIVKKDIIDACKGNAEYENFFGEVWDDVITQQCGDCIPFGKYYDEFFSILRFNAAWNTASRGGRQQELRQVYWFVREFGEKINVEVANHNFYEFFLLPTYNEIKENNISNFEKFTKLFKIIEKIWDLEYTSKHNIQGKKIRSMKQGKAWPLTRDEFVRYINNEYVDKNILSADEAHVLGILVDMFDRFPRRAAGFIWSVMSISDLDYKNWTKSFIDEFYLYVNNNTSIAVYPKVVACFLQQGFGNESAIPIDTWIESFIRYPLGMYGPQVKPEYTKNEQSNWELQEFFKSFDKRAMLERLIWRVSQSKKVNMNPVFDVIWCIRIGRTGEKNGILREQNPISCFQCRWRNKCVGYSSIATEYVWIVEGDINDTIRNTALKNKCKYICTTTSMVPKKIERLMASKKSKTWLYIDEFSGLRMKPSHITNLSGKNTVNDLMTDLEQHDYFSD